MPGQSEPFPRDLPFDAFIAALRAALARPLPGGEGHARMAPVPRPGWSRDLIPADARPAGALLLFFPRDGRPHLLLTLRSLDLPNHRGQVSLPGGMLEPGEIPRDAALREAQEEAGVDPATVTLLGELSPLFIPVSGFALHPFVGFTGTRPEFRAQPGEVERILEIPLDALREPSCVGAEERHLLDAPRRVRFFRLDGETVWGATAMVLAELLCILGDPPPPPET